ncbi:MAG TPA: sigma-70 family RNA polymerase sigma factor [Thermoanaerobaculia bacterium]|jgi:RNA polymerase sigma factor (TIGR02999 family)|nr:sigma-70 family RNA polymerase sigma factor [Thermoanaerobaculia bacterium]
MTAPETEFSRLLASWRRGEDGASDQLFSLVYEQLRELAHRQVGGRSSGETLRTTALVHEAYLKLVRSGSRVNDRHHFYALAARAMRQILVDHARGRAAVKRGGGLWITTLDDEQVADPHAQDVLALDEALERLARLDERLGRLVELRYFAGLSIEETAAVLTLSPATVKRDWRTARAFLFDALHPSAGE